MRIEDGVMYLESDDGRSAMRLESARGDVALTIDADRAARELGLECPDTVTHYLERADVVELRDWLSLWLAMTL